MHKEYERSIQAIKDYDRRISVKEWNKIAKEYNFLSAKTLTIMSKKNFSKLNEEIRKS